MEELKENKFVVDMLNGYKLSGIFDLYNDATGTVTDYKTASVQKVLKNDWDEYRKQTLFIVGGYDKLVLMQTEARLWPC